MPTSEELLELAEPCAKKIDISQGMRHFPSFSEAEEQCEDELQFGSSPKSGLQAIVFPQK